MQRKWITLRDWQAALEDMERTFKLPKVGQPNTLKYEEEHIVESLVGRVIRETKGATKAELKRLLLRSLQILPLLPNRDPGSPEKRRSEARNLRNLSARMRRWADELQRAWMLEHERQRVFLEARGLRESFRRLPELLRDYADLREKMYAHTRVRYLNPNPQLRWTQYILNFFYIVTDKRPYGSMADLIDAAFSSAGKTTPAWADRERLAQEMRRRARRHFPNIFL